MLQGFRIATALKKQASSYSMLQCSRSHEFLYENLLLDCIAKWPDGWSITLDLEYLSVASDSESHPSAGVTFGPTEGKRERVTHTWAI